MKKKKLISNRRYDRNPVGWDFSHQYSMMNIDRRFTRKDQDARFRVIETDPTIKIWPYGRHHALPGQTVWVLMYDPALNKFRVVADVIDDVHCFYPTYMSSGLRQYWLYRGVHNSGLEPGIHFWFTKKQAEYALSKMNYFRDCFEHRKWRDEYRKSVSEFSDTTV